MITGNRPLLIFKFNIPFLGLPFLTIPIQIDERNTGVAETKIDTNISITTDTMPDGSLVQKSFGNSMMIEFSVSRRSIFATVVLPLLKRIFSTANINNATFGLVKSEFNYHQSYTTSYWSGNQYIIDGVVSDFGYQNTPNTDLSTVTFTLVAPTDVVGGALAGGLAKGKEIVNQGLLEAIA